MGLKKKLRLECFTVRGSEVIVPQTLKKGFLIWNRTTCMAEFATSPFKYVDYLRCPNSSWRVQK